MAAPYKSRRLRVAQGLQPLPPKRLSQPPPEWVPPKGARFQPWRLTLALDACDLFDPELSEALGCVIGDVDRWEEGIDVPTVEQEQTLCEVTGYGRRWFYHPKPPEPVVGFLCPGGMIEPDQYEELWGGRWKIVRDRPDANLPRYTQGSLI